MLDFTDYGLMATDQSKSKRCHDNLLVRIKILSPFRLNGKSVTEPSLQILSHVKRVATLPNTTKANTPFKRQ